LVKSALAQGSTHFAIADFDGDLRPDLAMIRVSRDGVPDAQYSLELQFSSGTRAPIGLVGPAGGLEISPQDVNGDQIADLVITSAVDAQFVAILVNDGKGNFRQVDRAEYPEVGRRAKSSLLAPADSWNHDLAISQAQTFLGDVTFFPAWRFAQDDSTPLWPGFVRVPRYSAVRLESGRAPPI
jgi:hypothetical protein